MSCLTLSFPNFPIRSSIYLNTKNSVWANSSQTPHTHILLRVLKFQIHAPTPPKK